MVAPAAARKDIHSEPDMDITLRFDRGNNVFNFMVLTVEEMRSIVAYRKSHCSDYKFMYDRELLERILGHAVTFWVPDGFTAYEEGMRLLVRTDNTEYEVPLSEVNVEFADPQPSEPAGGDEEAPRMVTAVMGCQGRDMIEYTWSGQQGSLDPARLTLRVRTQEHGRDMLLVISEVLYAGAPATRVIRADTCPEWLWEPAFFPDDGLDMKS